MGFGGGEEVDSDRRLVEQWNAAAATYGICRPGVSDDVVYVHRQTTERFAIAPDAWDLIPVGHDAPPTVILEDVARVRDIGECSLGGCAVSTSRLLSLND